MAEPKTRPTGASVTGFLKQVEPKRRADCKAIAKLMREVTGKRPQMWGSSIVGYGSYHYRYASGREGEWPTVGFSPRKQDLTLYIMAGFSRYESLLAKLGKFKHGKSCLYIKKLEDVDMRVLERLIRESVAHVLKRWA
jgi:hypothetical protein